MDGASGEGAAAGEEVVYEHKGCRREKQQLSGVTADVFRLRGESSSLASHPTWA
jgi:hypothetical protein